MTLLADTSAGKNFRTKKLKEEVAVTYSEIDASTDVCYRTSVIGIKNGKIFHFM